MLRCLRQRMLRIIIEAEAITQILFLSVLDHIKSMVEIIVPFLCQIYLFRSLESGVCNKIVFAPNFVFRKLIQRNDVVQILRLKRYILRADVVDHGVPYCGTGVCQKQISAVGIVAIDAAEQAQRAFLYKIVK